MAKSDWTIDNVLPENKEFVGEFYKGILGIPGGLSCPWCNSTMTEKDKSHIAVCDANEDHVVRWLPWGG